ncbi:GNAT family N-acetyltransferase [Janibacter melonis]|uniref:GNAT family N-acetyltransferase n=1 Tax=Janibacter melonis TaxID=262209 RepID=A0A5P8FI38_9MICO|nr:GNAT family N-acetyltransferase [Janibacter melonis]QFQ29155.1 GNAT family N-acetyltransferase [Janibacter melonis]
MSTSTSAPVREATVADVPDILRLITELAVYEREPDAVEATVESLSAALFPADGAPTAFCHVAEVDGPQERRVVGMALWFLTFSTWTGRNGIWLEDLYVEPDQRGSGLGLALLRTLAQVCRERGYPRLEWTVLDWNEPSIAFYRAAGALPQDEWTTQRLTGHALAGLAEG